MTVSTSTEPLSMSLLRTRVGATLRTGRPGVHVLPEDADPALLVEPMDVAAFVGVAARGPAYEVIDDPALREMDDRPPGTKLRVRSIPVPVESWDEFERRFGGDSGPGRLAAAVRQFFHQGGRRAFVVRIVPPLPIDDQPFTGRAAFAADLGRGATLVVRSRNEGSWGNNLDVVLRFETEPVHGAAAPDGAVLRSAMRLADEGELLRVTDDLGVRSLHSVVRVRIDGNDDRRPIVTAIHPPLNGGVRRVEAVTGMLEVVDTGASTSFGQRRERHRGLRFSVGHPSDAASVLASGSELLECDDTASAADLTGLHPALPPLQFVRFVDGTDRWQAISLDDVTGPIDTPALDSTQRWEGLHAIATVPEVAMVIVPDLYEPLPLLPVLRPAPSIGSSVFEPCGEEPAAEQFAGPAPGLDGLRLDPRDPRDLELIIDRQLRVVAAAERIGAIALLDVPPALNEGNVRAWRASFDSSFAAAYHPWLQAGDAHAAAAVAPSAVAAGVIAATEGLRGLGPAPANRVVREVFDVVQRLSPDRIGALHHAGVNTFALDGDGVRLISAHTLSSQREWRQLTARRIVTMVERVIVRQLAWLPFEPNNAGLHAMVTGRIDDLLFSLFRRGLFAGSSPSTSYFVRVDRSRQRSDGDSGTLVVEIGLALAEPLEFIMLRVRRSSDGDVSSESTGQAGASRG